MRGVLSGSARAERRLRFASILTAVASALWMAQFFVLAQAVESCSGPDAEIWPRACPPSRSRAASRLAGSRSMRWRAIRRHKRAGAAACAVSPARRRRALLAV